jgi:hypothetical protein
MGDARERDVFMVSGLILGWGRTWIHQIGFRSQFARVLALVVPADDDNAPPVDVAERIATRYGVPLLSSWEYATAIAAEWNV